MRNLTSTEQYERRYQVYPNVNPEEWCDEIQSLQEFRHNGTQLAET